MITMLEPSERLTANLWSGVSQFTTRPSEPIVALNRAFRGVWAYITRLFAGCNTPSKDLKPFPHASVRSCIQSFDDDHHSFTSWPLPPPEPTTTLHDSSQASCDAPNLRSGSQDCQRIIGERAEASTLHKTAAIPSEQPNAPPVLL
jgi:hypothetical protein